MVLVQYSSAFELCLERAVMAADRASVADDLLISVASITIRSIVAAILLSVPEHLILSFTRCQQMVHSAGFP